ncbi:MAG TPA: hypothetical protein VLG49_05985 [Rhabdochlamydiaceae bacterium]|nr:hypothetical protein [Rhabdochlamydiaceae bacterium]
MKKILALFFAIVSFSQVMARPDITWNLPVTLSSVGVNASDPRVVMDSSGNVTAAWVESGVIKAVMQPVGGSFGTPITISNTGSSSPRLAVDPSGNVTAIWLESGVVSSATHPFGGSWSAEVAVSSSTATTPALVVDSSGNAIAIWQRSNTIETATKLSGGAWGSVSVLSSSNSDNPALAVGGTTAVAVWHNVLSGADILQFSKQTVGGSWSTAANMFNVTPGFSHNFPSVAVDPKGNATAVWYRYTLQDGTFTGVITLSTQLASGATNWGALPTLISNSFPPGLEDDVSKFFTKVKTDPNGNVIAVWLESTDASNYFWEANVKPFNGNWATSAFITAPGLYRYGVDLAVNALGDALMGYMSFDGTNLNIQTTEAEIAGNATFVAFTAPITISQGTDNGFPKVATDLNGTTVFGAAVWLQFDGSETVVQAATGSRSTIAAPTNVTVTQSSTNFGVFTDFFNTVNWTASTSPNIIQYFVYRNGIFFQAIDATAPLQVVDHNAVQNGAVTYGVSAVDAQNTQSLITTQSFP